MSRYIHIADGRNRDAVVVFTNQKKNPLVYFVTQDKKKIRNQRVLKSGDKCSYETLIKQFKSADGLTSALIKGDPEIDLKLTGKYIRSTSRVFINQNMQPVYRVNINEQIFSPDGTLKEERIPKETISNISTENPIRPSGKLFPKVEIYNKFVFAKKYQLFHTNGLTFDFLYQIASELHEKNSMMLVGAGPKGTEPLVFQDGGKSYRAFLEGRIKNDTYILLLHLSNLEIKAIA